MLYGRHHGVLPLACRQELDPHKKFGQSCCGEIKCFRFLRAKPGNVSLLSLMSDWPWYIPQLVAVGAASAVIYYLPFAVRDLVARKG